MSTKTTNPSSALAETRSDDLAEKYSALCDFFWRLEHPETPEDGLRHTSSRCRALSLQVFELLNIETPAT